MNADKVNEAARQIAVILRDLEKETGELVEDLVIQNIDDAVYGGPTQIIRRVWLRMHRLPGTRWGQLE